MTRDEIVEKLAQIDERITQIKSRFKQDAINQEIADLEKQMTAPDFYTDLRKSGQVGKRLRYLQELLAEIQALTEKVDAVKFIVESATDDELLQMNAELTSEEKVIDKASRKLWISALLGGKYDACNAILTVHSGAGGTEATDWADMLFRMYQRYCVRSNFSFNIIDIQEGDTTGIKSATIEVEGENAYGYLRCEKGVHRLVRISPFDSNARRHTSFASVEVTPVIENESEELLINEDDLKIDTYRASGAGGQHINKTESAVRIKHIPTGIVVQCQNERSQIQNRATAMKMLTAKLAEMKEQEEREKISNIQGELKKIEWGSQIRSYVFHPYTMVKDHRTGCETPDITSVMDGDIQEFINDYLIKENN